MRIRRWMRITITMCAALSVLAIQGEPPVQKLPGSAPADWKETLEWLGQNFMYPESGPNYDWPSTEKPRVVNDSVMALDGTIIPVLPGASDVTLTDGKHSTAAGPYPAVSIEYEVKTADRATLSGNYRKLGNMFKKYNVDLDSFSRTSPGDYIIIKGNGEGFECELLIPGKVRSNQLEFAEGGTMTVQYTVRGIAHFYFFRTNLLVVNDQVTLSDGTRLPIFPGKKIVEVDTGNVQGGSPEVHTGYSFYVPDHARYPAEFVQLYTLYAKRFNFPVSAYKVWDQDQDGFKIKYEDEKIIVVISTGGLPLNGGLQTNIDGMFSADKFLSLAAEVNFKNKEQMIPGQNAQLPKPPEPGKKPRPGRRRQ